MSVRTFPGKLSFGHILIIGIILRFIAVVFSQGYMAHDDHFETIEIAWSWHHDGVLLDDGTLRWEGKPDFGVQRSASYNLFLLLLMKVTALFGVEHLDAHMYFNRFVHALLSLLPLIFGYRYLRENTDDQTAKVGGLLLAAHFLMPFLAVRNLAEMAAGDLLIPGIYYAHRAVKNHDSSAGDLVKAGIFCGVAVMIRYQAAAAVVALPIAMVLSSKKWKQSVILGAVVAAILLIQATIDLYTHGQFWGSFRSLVGHLGEATIPGPWYRYILLLLAIMVPPFSLLFVGSIFQKQVVQRHLVLWSALLCYMVIHSMITEKQERFMATIVPMLLVLGCVGIYQLKQTKSVFRQGSQIWKWLWGWFIVINLALLIVFTFNYGKRGAVDSLVYLSRQPDADRVLIDMSERPLFIPYSYFKYDRSGVVLVRKDSDLDSLVAVGTLSTDNPPKYAVIFTDIKLEDHLDKLRAKLGDYELVHHSSPSIIDAIANKLNPKYNRRNESWVVKLLESP